MQITRPKEFSVTTVILLVLLGISAWVAIMIFQALSETAIFESLAFANPAVKHLVGKVDIASWKRYANKTAGFALRYPNDWYVENVAVDQDAGGDVMVGGKRSALFEIAISPPSGFGISVQHVFPAYDNQPPELQKENTINLSRPLAGAYYELKSVSGAPYLRSYTQAPNEEDKLVAWIPTGKYILAVQAMNLSKGRDIEIFDAILKTVELK